MRRRLSPIVLVPLIFGAALAPRPAAASLPTWREPAAEAGTGQLPQLPPAIEDLERREGQRASCGVFCAEPLDLRLEGSLLSQEGKRAWGLFGAATPTGPSNYAKARMYSPTIGRFIQQDTWAGRLNDPPSLNLFLYANANPTRFIDPDGHAPKEGQQPPGWLVGIVEGTLDFMERVEKLPDQISQGFARLLTPGAPENKGEFAERQRQLLAVTKDPKAPFVARVDAAEQALKMQPGVIVEEAVVRPLQEAPGHAKAAGVHLAQAATTTNKVDQAVHLLEATKEASESFTGFAAPFALASGRPKAAAVPDEAIASRTLRIGEAAADDLAPRSAPIADPSRLLPAGSIDDAIASSYQRYYTEAARDVVNAFNQGKIKIPAGMNWEPVLGGRIDAIARARLRNFLGRENIAEGPAADVLVNRWLRDPSGSGAYRIPDVMLRDSHRILDGTIGSKTPASPQIQDFVTFSGGYSVEIVRPDVAPFRR